MRCLQDDVEPQGRVARLLPAWILAMPESLQLVSGIRRFHMNSPSFSGAPQGNKPMARACPEPEIRPVVLRLENIPATTANMARVGARIRDLNHLLEASGTPFRLRLL